jgi:hypothetical protein
MTGVHRRTEQDPVWSVLKSVRWLLGLVGLIAGSLAFVGIPAYLIVTDSKFLPVASMAVQGIVAVELARRLALKLLRNDSPSPVVLADWIGDAALVVGWMVTVLANIGTNQRWMHGAFEFAVLSVLALFLVGLPVYWFRGERRLVLALTARAVAGRWPWSAGQ